MSNWRRKHILMAENDSDPKAAREYDQTIHGKITSFEEYVHWTVFADSSAEIQIKEISEILCCWF
jgi:hypothetical protein